MLLEIMIKTYKKYYMSTYIIDILPYFFSLKHFGADEPDGRFEVCTHTSNNFSDDKYNTM